MPYLSETIVPSSSRNSSPGKVQCVCTYRHNLLNLDSALPMFSLEVVKRVFSNHNYFAGYLDPYLETWASKETPRVKFFMDTENRKTQEGSGCWEDSNPRERFMNNKPLTGSLSGLGGLPERNWISKSGMDFSWREERWYMCFQKPLSSEVNGRAVPDFSKRIPSGPSCWQMPRGSCYSELKVGPRAVAVSLRCELLIKTSGIELN